uniref:Retrovirus-related Pol polyprotein from transposon TNT 1-94 n=1 Tax=Tanacetum cinerariifolium TaxID=118510 RepID=A0A6L2LHR1_TANCI|nr:retrovirus-related Pol polyprotein from transposon TNT 1-94 [Tanacetum cinerariifolium]
MASFNAIPEFRDTLIQHLESVKKSIDERVQLKIEYDSWVNDFQIQTTEKKIDTSKALDASSVDTECGRTESKEHDTSSRSGNDAHYDDADIRPIYDEEPMAESVMSEQIMEPNLSIRLFMNFMKISASASKICCSHSSTERRCRKTKSDSSGSCSYNVDILKSSIIFVSRTNQYNLLYPKPFHDSSLIHKTPYELTHDKKPDSSFLYVFGSPCYPTNDSEDLGKLNAKADIGIFVGYTPIKKDFRIYNRRTKKIMETVHVTFDELTAMAFEQLSSGPGLQPMTPATSIQVADTPRVVDTADSLVSTLIDQYAPTSSGSGDEVGFQPEVPEEPKGMSVDIHEGTGLNPGVPDVSKAYSSESEYESLGDSGNEANVQETNDDEEESDNEFVHTPEDYVPTDDEADDETKDVDEEDYKRINEELYGDVNVRLTDAEHNDEEKEDSETTDATHVQVKQTQE